MSKEEDELITAIDNRDAETALIYLRDPEYIKYLVASNADVEFILESIISRGNVQVFDAFITIPDFAYLLTGRESRPLALVALYNNNYDMLDYFLKKPRVIAAIKYNKVPCDALRYAVERLDMDMIRRLLQVPEIVALEENCPDFSPAVRQVLQLDTWGKKHKQVVCMIAAVLWKDSGQMLSDPKIAQLRPEQKDKLKDVCPEPTTSEPLLPKKKMQLQ